MMKPDPERLPLHEAGSDDPATRVIMHSSNWSLPASRKAVCCFVQPVGAVTVSAELPLTQKATNATITSPSATPDGLLRVKLVPLLVFV
jgi:hypothetical protein